MRIKTINSIISGKFNDFLKSIKDEKVRKLVQDNTIITGGAITSLLLGDKVNDFDLYFRNKETVWEVANYFVKKSGDTNAEVIGGGFTDEAARMLGDKSRMAQCAADKDRIRVWIQSSGYVGELPKEEDFDLDGEPITTEEKEEVSSAREKYTVSYISANAITLSDKIQIVLRFYGEPDKIHENYDFEHCKNYWTSWDSKVVTNQKALECILAKELVYTGSKYPLCSIFRTRKFIERGWRINAGQYLKMAMQLNEMDLTDIDILEEQLVGVDAHYFVQVIESIRSRNIKIDSTYISEIVDRMF